MLIATLRFPTTATVPNHPRWPVILYKNAVPADAHAARTFEERFAAHGWQGGWRGEVYDYVHYHVDAHEVLGVASGSATLRLGGDAGEPVRVTAGDCVLLPAGTGHQCLDASRDFEVVAAYPPGQSPDLQTQAATDEQRRAIAALPAPPTDPMEGPGGAVGTHWRRAAPARPNSA